jgi:hypothetical protein
VILNCIEMTMGLPYRDGGWWTTLDLEYQSDQTDGWRPVDELMITPPYSFQDVRDNHRPYETHALTFRETTVRSVRLIGTPVGVAQFTALARIAAFQRDFAR